MGNKKNIDRLFREKFKHFEATPDAHVWAAIEKRLGKSKKDRRVVPLIIRYGGIAAAIALLLTLGYNLNPNHNPVNPQTITNTRENTNDNTSTILKENTTASQNNVAHTDRNENYQITPVTNKTASRNPVVAHTDNTSDAEQSHKTAMEYPISTDAGTEDRLAQNENETTRPPLTKENENTVVVDKAALLDALRKETVTEKAVAQHTPERERWSITPNAAPVYFNSLENGSPIDRQFHDNTKTGNITMSYGVNVAYEVSNRLSVRSGINRVSYGYNTDNIEFTPALQASSLENISYRNEAKNITVADANTPQTIPLGSSVTANKVVAYEGRMVQELGYLEVPLEVKYSLSKKKLGVHLIGGLSSLFLTDNTVSLETQVLTTQIGEASNINEVNFSTNIGVGVDYTLFDKVMLNVEPMFKYQLNTFSNDDGGFKPYSLGVYTGLSFRF